MWSDDDFLNKYESWKMGTHLQTIAVMVVSLYVLISLVVVFVRDRPTSFDAWVLSILALPMAVLLATLLLCLPVNLLAFHAMVRSARRRRRDDPESYRTIVLPALDDTHGIPLRLMRLYRRVGLDPRKE